jgi:hypothetical protein
MSRLITPLSLGFFVFINGKGNHKQKGCERICHSMIERQAEPLHPEKVPLILGLLHRNTLMQHGSILRSPFSFLPYWFL